MSEWASAVLLEAAAAQSPTSPIGPVGRREISALPTGETDVGAEPPFWEKP